MTNENGIETRLNFSNLIENEVEIYGQAIETLI
jgi:hypothetical protein